jgi:hypothetical protein
MKRETKCVLASLATGILVLAGLWVFCYFTLTNQPIYETPINIAAVFVAFLITIPLFLACGAGICSAPLWLLVVTALFDVACMSGAIYLLLSAWRMLWRRLRPPVQQWK